MIDVASSETAKMLRYGIRTLDLVISFVSTAFRTPTDDLQPPHWHSRVSPGILNALDHRDEAARFGAATASPMSGAPKPACLEVYLLNE